MSTLVGLSFTGYELIGVIPGDAIVFRLFFRQLGPFQAGGESEFPYCSILRTDNASVHISPDGGLHP